ncbi:exo-alpha-sialidase [Arthrobacter sp. CAU 1506]|uniref:F510_1955 family glycosylhydrolase n=1 Tax=Arthrobacter sp. CAU 1506 TaxID=2560052 RepID=UPI0010AD2D6D|nr:exo-alpha-sialidase [Arthrobacter sp. CAU 1506]TJY70487.1 exo-alpha-sialidase [Arthrobacter sp. CAU 1506]
MPRMISTRARVLQALTGAAALALLATSCASPGDAAATSVPPAANSNPFGHVHGMFADADTGQVVLATHNGLFDVSAEPAEKLSPTIDLMGFAPMAEAGHFYASGHPGAGSDLPNPVGLIHSNDGGKTWKPLSRQGESDFHALTTTRAGIIGFDGQLRISADGHDWSTVQTSLQPLALAGSPESDIVLATTEDGVQRSTDGGSTWSLPDGAPLLLFTAFADAGTAVGVAPDSTIQVSRDAGITWEQAGKVSAPAAAITAAADGEGRLHIWVATDNGVEYSVDGGATFSTDIS